MSPDQRGDDAGAGGVEGVDRIKLGFTEEDEEGEEEEDVEEDDNGEEEEDVSPSKKQKRS